MSLKAASIMDPEPKPPQSPHQPVPLQQPSPAPSNPTKTHMPEVAGKPDIFAFRGETPSDDEDEDTSGKSHTNTDIHNAMEVAEEGSLFVADQPAGLEVNTPQSKAISPVAEPAKETNIEQTVYEILKPAISGDLKAGDDHLSGEHVHPDNEDGSNHIGDGVAYGHENDNGNGDGSDHEGGFEYGDGSDASYSLGEEEEDKPCTSSNKPKTNKPRRKVALNAREYVARLHEEEDKKYAKKMEQEESSDSRPGKRKATAIDEWPRKTPKTGRCTNLLSLDGGASTSAGDPLPTMEPFKARTHAEQFAQLKAQIPHNCDTRRRNTQNQDLHEAAKLFGYRRIVAENGRWRLKGMETGLEGYQLTAVAWMVKRELARAKPYSGLLADAMGMGKTVMSLACIVGNQADAEHRREYCNATLVVVPNKTFGQQWEREARKHCKAPVGDKVFIYDPNYQGLIGKCEESFIVITTYMELLSQYPSKRTLQGMQEQFGSDDISYQRQLRAIVGPLFQINWYRVLLDESHAIKNVESRTSQACCALWGKYRWALSGTPLANTSDEMYPYLKFTQCESTWSLKEFKKMYTSYGKVNGQFEALTSLIMYRRTLKDDFLGLKIINLPEQKETDLLVPLSAEEQVIVDAVKTFYKNKMEALQQGTLDQDALAAAVDGLESADDPQQDASGQAVSKALTEIEDEADDEEQAKKREKKSTLALGRLSWRLSRASQVRKRQAISHTFCIERLLRHSFEPNELEDLREALKQVAMKSTILKQMCSARERDDGIWRYERGLQLLQQRKEAVFGQHFDMERLLTLARDENAVRGITCRLCGDATPPVQPMRLPKCNHVFCSICLCNLYGNSLRNEKKPECPYEDCGQVTAAVEVDTLQSNLDTKPKEYREPGKDSNNAGVHIADDRNGFFICGTMLDDASVVPSTRLTATMAVVLTWLHEAPDDKILIFTQFTGTAKVLGYMLQTLDIGFVYYYGGLALGLKRRALEAIKTRPEVKVMVSTLKAGGQCLNLTVANRVVIIDPWWNKTAEQQAFGRVTRMGQEKVTHLVNIRTADEIDERICTLQKRKAADVDYTLQDDGHTPPKISELELQQAFFRKKSVEGGKAKESKKKAPAANKTPVVKETRVMKKK